MMFSKKFDPDQARAEMVERQLARRDITDPRVLQAMADVPRHRFVSPDQESSAYKDRPLSIGFGQTISQPYIVAFMTQALRLAPDAIVLEIGTGSGYQAAVLGRLAAQVFTVERLAPLAERARKTFDQLAISNIRVRVGDGGYGWPGHTPFDGIVVTAAAPQIPAPLTAQLKDGARLIVPVGPRGEQNLLCLQRCGNKIERSILVPVAFVPLLGEHGWQ